MLCRELNITNMRDIVTLGRQNAEELAPHMVFDDAVAMENARDIAMDDFGMKKAWIAYDHERPVGYLIAYKAPYLWCHGFEFRCELVYVTPDARYSTAFVHLMAAFANAARSDTSILESTVGIAVDMNVETFTKMITRLGYTPVGMFARCIHASHINP